MAKADRTGNRIPRSAFKKRIPDLGRYFIYTDADETEEKYMYGLRDSLPKEFQGRIVIKVSCMITGRLGIVASFSIFARYLESMLMISANVLRDRCFALRAAFTSAPKVSKPGQSLMFAI